jgi:exonuclease III
MNLVSWNCRGLGNPSKIEVVKELLKADPSYILMLQETKIEGQSILEISGSNGIKDQAKQSVQGEPLEGWQLFGLNTYSN